MKRITITVENEAGQQLMSMGTSITTELLLLDMGSADGMQKNLVKNLCQQAQLPLMTFRLSEENATLAESKELSAPMYAVAVNSGDTQDMGLANGPIHMDTLRHEVYIEGKKISLTPREYDLLHCFLSSQGRILHHRDILKQVWGPEHADDTQYLRVYIGQLRHKLEAKPGLGKVIVAKAGVGYRMDQVCHARLKVA